MSKESTGKRITDELRACARTFIGVWVDSVSQTITFTTSNVAPTVDSIRMDSNLLAIADRIDEALAERYVELPKDADGEYIHVGDVMDGIDKYNSLREVTGRVSTISFEADGLVDVAVQARNDDGKSWRRAYLDPDASVYRHHKHPTVEDVLRDYGSRILIAGCIDEEDALVAEYAAKLQLRGDGE